MKDKDDVLYELKKHNYITTKELKRFNVSQKDINDMLLSGQLNRVARGYYKTNISSKDFDYKKSVLRIAKTELQNGNYDKVINIVSNYKNIQTSKNAHYILYNTYLLMGEYKKAKEELLKSILLSKEQNSNKEFDLYAVDKLIEQEEEIISLKKELKK